MGKLFIALFLIAVFAAVAAILAALCCGLWLDVIESLERRGFSKNESYERGYKKGRLEAMLETAKYPMGIYTFPVACSHCANLNSDKCYRCKEEIRSGFELKTNEEVAQ